MKRARFTEDQIIGVLKEHEAGVKTGDLAAQSMACRKRRFTTGRPKYGGMDVSEAKRLKQLKDENAKLKKLFGRADVGCRRAFASFCQKKW